MRIVFFCKGVFFLKYAFFFLFFSSSSLFGVSSAELWKQAQKQKLFEKTYWQILLHSEDGEPNFINSTFLLSSPFSPKVEMQKTLEAFFIPPDKFFSIDEHPVCRFPGRYLWLSEQLNFETEISPNNCPAFQMFLNEVHPEKLSVVFVSQDLKNASTLMGHIFLKLYSNKEGKQIPYAITYYTLVENPWQLIYKSFLTHSPGILNFRPSFEIERNYLQTEERNLWEFFLDTEKENLKKFLYHLWELKELESEYSFGFYNCGTMVHELLEILYPQLKKHPIKKWAAPIDYLKNLSEQDLIKETQVNLSAKNKIIVLQKNLSNQERKKSEEWIDSKTKNFDFLEWNSKMIIYAKSVIDYEYSNQEINKKEYQKAKKSLDQILPPGSYNLNLEIKNSPISLPDSSYVRFGYGNDKKGDFWTFGVSPTFLLLDDDRTRLFGEFEIQILNFNFAYYPDHDEIDLKRFDALSSTAIVPFNSYISEYSYTYQFGAEESYDEKSFPFLSWGGEGGIGVGYEPLTGGDILAFAFLKAKYEYSSKNDHRFFFIPELGMFIYEIWNMKTLLRHNLKYSSEGKIWNIFEISQNLYFSKNHHLQAKGKWIQAPEKDGSSVELSYKLRF